jgi:hypothetical protein
MNTARNLAKSDKYLEDIFANVEDSIIAKTNETLYSQAEYKLVRKNVFDKSIQTAYFNIDALCEKMEAYTTLYSCKKGLLNILDKHHNIKSFEDVVDLPMPNEQKEKEREVEDDKKQIIDVLLQAAKGSVITCRIMGRFSDILDILIKNAQREVKYFYECVKKFYPYVELEALTDKLIEVGHQTSKKQRNMNNAIVFWILDNEHPFKTLMLNTFKKSQKYDSETIFKEMKVIFNSLNLKYVKKQKAVEYFNLFFDTTCSNGIYTIKGTNPLGLPEPLQTVSKETKLNNSNFFNFETGQFSFLSK